MQPSCTISYQDPQGLPDGRNLRNHRVQPLTYYDFIFRNPWQKLSVHAGIHVLLYIYQPPLGYTWGHIAEFWPMRHWWTGSKSLPGPALPWMEEDQPTCFVSNFVWKVAKLSLCYSLTFMDVSVSTASTNWFSSLLSLNNLATQRTANHAREWNRDYYHPQIQKIIKMKAVMKFIFYNIVASWLSKGYYLRHNLQKLKPYAFENQEINNRFLKITQPES